MIIISQYRLKETEDGYFRVHSYEITVCPVCGHTVIVIGSRKRKCIDEAGVKQILIIRRLRCKECRVIHHELPDMLVPYKRHCAVTVEKIIIEEVDDICCESHTIHRIRTWWAACQLYFDSIMASLCEKYGIVFTSDPAPREIIRAVVNAHLWIHTRSAYLSG